MRYILFFLIISVSIESYSYYWVRDGRTNQYASAVEAATNDSVYGAGAVTSASCGGSETSMGCSGDLWDGRTGVWLGNYKRLGTLDQCPNSDGINYEADEAGFCSEVETIEDCLGLGTNDLGFCALNLDDGSLKDELTNDFPEDLHMNECIGDRCLDSSLDGQVCGTNSDGELFCVNDPDSNCSTDSSGNYLCVGGNTPDGEYNKGGRTYDPHDGDILDSYDDFEPEVTVTENPDGSTTTSTTHPDGSTSHRTTYPDGSEGEVIITYPSPDNGSGNNTGDGNGESEIPTVSPLVYEKGDDTFNKILGDFKGDLQSTPLVNSLTNLTIPTGGGSCSAITIDTGVAGVHEMSSHCELISSSKDYIKPLMLLVWSILAILLVFKL